MTGENHSPVGASSYYRWKACPGSVRLCKTVPNRSSKEAAEGTLAHALAAQHFKEGPKVVENRIGEIVEVDGHKIEVTREMTEHVANYVAAIRADMEEGDTAEVEVEFHLASVHPDLWGTADCVIYRPKKCLLIVRDLKYGAGVLVDVVNNKQLMYYALGALLHATGGRKDVREVELVINQPRCGDEPERRWKFQVVDLIDFRADLKADVAATEEPNAPLVPGDHCKFCSAAHICPKLREKAREVAHKEFTAIQSAVPTYTPDQLAEALDWTTRLENWISSVREHAYDEAMRGRPAPGYKLVAKKTYRAWTNLADAEQAMRLDGLDDERIFEPRSMRSPAQIEESMGKRKFKDSMTAGFVHKPEASGYTLVPESDKRQGVTLDAKSDFAALPAAVPGALPAPK